MTNPEDGGGLVELVDPTGRAIGTSGKLDAHAAPGHLHRAVSVFLLDRSDRLLVQRRAAGKYHSGGLWRNTCCGHPRRARVRPPVRRPGDKRAAPRPGRGGGGRRPVARRAECHHDGPVRVHRLVPNRSAGGDARPLVRRQSLTAEGDCTGAGRRRRGRPQWSQPCRICGCTPRQADPQESGGGQPVKDGPARRRDK